MAYRATSIRNEHPGAVAAPRGRLFQWLEHFPFKRSSSEEEPAEPEARSEEHTSELQSLMRISYAVFCLKTKTTVVPIHKPRTTPITAALTYINSVSTVLRPRPITQSNP